MSKNVKSFNKTDKRVLWEKLNLLKVSKLHLLDGIDANRTKIGYSTYVSVRNKVLQDLKAIDNVLNVVHNA